MYNVQCTPSISVAKRPLKIQFILNEKRSLLITWCRNCSALAAHERINHFSSNVRINSWILYYLRNALRTNECNGSWRRNERGLPCFSHPFSETYRNSNVHFHATFSHLAKWPELLLQIIQKFEALQWKLIRMKAFKKLLLLQKKKRKRKKRTHSHTLTHTMNKKHTITTTRKCALASKWKTSNQTHSFNRCTWNNGWW